MEAAGAVAVASPLRAGAEGAADRRSMALRAVPEFASIMPPTAHGSESRTTWIAGRQVRHSIMDLRLVTLRYSEFLGGFPEESLWQVLASFPPASRIRSLINRSPR